MSDELVNWLRAQLLIDEQKAREAQPGPWHIGNAVDPTQLCNVHTFPAATGVADGLRWLDAEHIALHDPSRVLREVEAKGRRLDRHHPVAADDTDWVACSHCHMTYPCPDIRDDLAVYSDRPGYQEAWRPA